MKTILLIILLTAGFILIAFSDWLVPSIEEIFAEPVAGFGTTIALA